MRLRGVTDAERERAVIERQVRHVVRLVDDLLDVSRITSGKVQLKRERVDLADLVAKAVEMTGPAVEERRHRLVIDVPRGMIVEGDPARLAQVFANLLTNAAKYTEDGGTIEISGRPSGGRVRLEVTDNGIGIATEMLPRVFELFMQERQGIDRSEGGLGLGLGLGLAIVRSLVSAHRRQRHRREPRRWRRRHLHRRAAGCACGPGGRAGGGGGRRTVPKDVAC